METTIYEGVIDYYSPNWHFGFIGYKDENSNEKRVRFHSPDYILEGRKQKWVVGDIVRFSIIVGGNAKNPDSEIAQIVDYMGNPKLDELRERFQNGDRIIYGYLVNNGGTLYFREASSNIQFRVRRSAVHVGYILPERGTLVRGQLVNAGRMNSAQVIPLDIECDETSKRFYNNLSNLFEGVVTDIQNNLLFVKLNDYPYTGTVSFKEGENTYAIGDSILVWVKKISGTSIAFSTMF